jgi:hypothetical protein
VILKIVLKAGYLCALEKLANESNGKPERNCMRLLEQLLELVSVFKEVRKKLHIFLLELCRLKI